MDVYAIKRRRVASLITRWRTGAVTLTRTTHDASEPATPWIPGEEASVIYTLDAVVNGVSAQHVDGTLILASDLLVIVAARLRATLTLHSDETPYDDGTRYLQGQPAGAFEIQPRMSDVITIDGRQHRIKRIEPHPAAGEPAMFNVFVAA